MQQWPLSHSPGIGQQGQQPEEPAGGGRVVQQTLPNGASGDGGGRGLRQPGFHFEGEGEAGEGDQGGCSKNSVPGTLLTMAGKPVTPTCAGATNSHTHSPPLPWSQPCRALCLFFRIQTGVTPYSTEACLYATPLAPDIQQPGAVAHGPQAKHKDGAGVAAGEAARHSTEGG